MSNSLSAGSPLRKRLFSMIYLRKAETAHEEGDYGTAEALYLRVVDEGSTDQQRQAIMGLQQLKVDARPIAVVYVDSPGRYLVDAIPEHARDAQVYPYARERAMQMGQAVAVETERSSLVFGADGSSGWCRKMPDELKEVLVREISPEPEHHGAFL